MYSMPGKISVTRKFTVDVEPSMNLEILLDDTVFAHDNGQCEIEDDTKEHTLTFNIPIDNVWVENISVKHLMVENRLTFTAPIYKWLFANIDTK
jgi:hypothetical protein